MTSAIPKGLHAVTPSLVIRDAAKAIEFYKKAFGAKENNRFVGPNGKIMHAEIQIRDSVLMISDEAPEWECLSPQSLKTSPVSFFIYSEDVDGLFNQAVECGASAKMPVADMFWGDRMGCLIDPFGHIWNIATHKQDLSEDQIKKNAEEFFKKAQPPKP